MKKSYSKKSKSVSKVNLALKKIKKIEKEFKPELKYSDSYTTPTTIANTSGGAIYELASPPVIGSGEGGRNGNDVFVKSVYHGIEFTGSESCRIRMIVFRDTRRSFNSQAGTLPNINTKDVLADLTYPMISPIQENQNLRFKVLSDRVINYDHDEYGKMTIRKWYKINKRMKFPTDAIDDATVNGLYFLLVTDASSAPSWISSNRMTYYDV